MIDTGRNFLTVTTLKMALDAMSYTKLNVSRPARTLSWLNCVAELRARAVCLPAQLLHWHLVDDQSFAIDSKALPKLAGDGAFSPRHTYSLADLQAVVSYGRERGIAVLPELDVSALRFALKLKANRLLTPRPSSRRCLGTPRHGRVATLPSKAAALPKQGNEPHRWTRPRRPPTTSFPLLWLSSTRSSRPSFRSGTWAATKSSSTAGG